MEDPSAKCYKIGSEPRKELRLPVRKPLKKPIERHRGFCLSSNVPVIVLTSQDSLKSTDIAAQDFSLVKYKFVPTQSRSLV